MYQDRTDAGKQLADRLRSMNMAFDAVLALPNGGLPVGRSIADTFGIPLDIISTEPVTAPEAVGGILGASGPGGNAWLMQDASEKYAVKEEYIEQERGKAAMEAESRERLLRGVPNKLDVDGKRVIIADDGSADLPTVLAAVYEAQHRGAGLVLFAVPIVQPEILRQLHLEAVEAVSLEEPTKFGVLGEFYQSLPPISNEKVRIYLHPDESPWPHAGLE